MTTLWSHFSLSTLWVHMGTKFLCAKHIYPLSQLTGRHSLSACRETTGKWSSEEIASQAWDNVSATPILERLRQGDGESKTRLGYYIARPSRTKKKEGVLYPSQQCLRNWTRDLKRMKKKDRHTDVHWEDLGQGGLCMLQRHNNPEPQQID